MNVVVEDVGPFPVHHRTSCSLAAAAAHRRHMRRLAVLRTPASDAAVVAVAEAAAPVFGPVHRMCMSWLG